MNGEWFHSLSEDAQDEVAAAIGLPERGNDRWYEEFAAVADRLYDDHLRAIAEEGLI